MSSKHLSLARRAVALAACVLMFATMVAAQAQPMPKFTDDGVWEVLDGISSEMKSARAPNIQPSRAVFIAMNWESMSAVLNQAPMEDTIAIAQSPALLALPAPDGTLHHFSFVESPVMQPELQARFPEIRTYLGQGIEDRSATIRFDRTPFGFHAQVLSPNGAWYVDPYFMDDTSIHSSYFKSDYALEHPEKRMKCETPLVTGLGESLEDGREDPVIQKAMDEVRASGGPRVPLAGTTRRQYIIGVSCTGQYAAVFGGTVPGALAAITTSVNRISGIYEIDLAARLVLHAEETDVIFTNSATDPYSNAVDSGQIDICEAQCASLLTAPVNVTHLVTTDPGGGLAGGIGNVCLTGNNGGATGLSAPFGDAFDVDFVAHELGHQFGGRHPMAGCNVDLPLEVGSGVTIMAYAGICGSEDFAAHSIPSFLSESLERMQAYISSRSCQTSTVTGNAIPTVNGGTNFAIPIGTPFTLTAVGGDTDGDAVTYTWEQRDSGAGSMLSADDGAKPLFRCYSPTTSPSRTFPKLSDIINNVSSVAERLPTVNRPSMDFTVTIRDNKAGSGGTATDQVALNVVGAAGPFAVTSPNAAGSFPAGDNTVTWNVANTTGAPISCANVMISLSTDGGNTFPTVLAASTANDGSEVVSFPGTIASTCRIKIEALGNVFWDMSNANFSLIGVAPNYVPQTMVVDDNLGNGNNNGMLEPGETTVKLTIPVQNNGLSGGTGVTGTLTSLTPTVSILSGSSGYPNIASGGTQSNSTKYMISVSAAHQCGSPISLQLQINSNEANRTAAIGATTGTTGAVVSTQYTTPVVTIVDNTTVTANLPITATGTIGDLDFSFDSSGACSTLDAATTPGLTHTWLGDISVTLVSPSNRQVLMMSRPGGTNNSGNHFCNTVLDDDAGAASIQGIAAAGNPYTGTFAPNAPLTTFNGDQMNGTWQVRVQDFATQDAGAIRRFTISVTPVSCAAVQGIPEADVFDGATPIGNGGGPINFGSTQQGGPAIGKIFRVVNNGVGPLRTANLTLPPGYMLAEPLATTIAPGGNNTFTVGIPSTTIGTFAGTISFTSNDVDETTYSWSVTGTVTAAAEASSWQNY